MRLCLPCHQLPPARTAIDLTDPSLSNCSQPYWHCTCSVGAAHQFHSTNVESLPQEFIHKLTDDPHIPIYAPVCSSENAGGEGAENTFRLRRALVQTQPGSLVREHPTRSIPTYVRSVRSERIHSWREPALFGRVPKVFIPMTTVERRCPTPPSHELTVFRAPRHLESLGRTSNNPPSCHHDARSRRSRFWFPPSRTWRTFFPFGTALKKSTFHKRQSGVRWYSCGCTQLRRNRPGLTWTHPPPANFPRLYRMLAQSNFLRFLQK